jgi:predicted homoserine dehydrogenase-like protein
MNLFAMLEARAEAGTPIRVGLIGAGKFATMFLAQALGTPGIYVAGIADLDVPRARQSLGAVGWPEERFSQPSFAKARATGATYLTDDPFELIDVGGLDVVIEATGDPIAGIRHALACIGRGRDVIMVNVEADALAGPLLARRAADAGVVYSLAYGDQPALICEQVDWARACGLEVVAAGKGTLYMPEFHASTPDTIWDYYGIAPERAAAAGMNPKMFNSFLDGTKSAIEMAAVANATGLTPAPDGLHFPPCEPKELARTLIPEADGGCLHHKGQVEVISSRRRDGRDLADDLRWGVYVTFEAPTEYAARCFSEYGLITGGDGRYSALWRPYHLIGLELGISVASVALRGEATGHARHFNADVVAVAKRDLAAGEVLDGEGGHCVYGKVGPAADSVAFGGLPIGLSGGVRLKEPVAADQPVRWRNVEMDRDGDVVRLRREMEAAFLPAGH